jgi:hypothetical protein
MSAIMEGKLAMNWLRDLLNTLFPYRALVAEELDYLRAQLAQKQRRIDELQDALISSKIAVPVERMRVERPSIKPAPRGIDEVRAFRRENPPEQPKPEEGPFKTEEQSNGTS